MFSGLEEIGVLEPGRTKRLKFGVSERSDRRKEREFGKFQWSPKGLSRFLHSLDFFNPFCIQTKGALTMESAQSKGTVNVPQGLA